MFDTLTMLLVIALLLVVASGALALWKAFFTDDDATRVVIADLIFFCALASFALYVIFRRSEIALDVLLLASLVGILSTVALARLLSRGER